MPDTSTVQRKTHEFRFALLLLSLFGAILIPPYFQGMEIISHVWRVLFSAVLVVALMSVAGNRRNMWFVGILLIPTMATTWLSDYTEQEALIYLDNLTTIVYLAVVSWFFVRFIFSARLVTLNVIYAAMCLYLILALVFAAIYANLHIFYDDAFQFAQPAMEAMANEADSHMSVFVYYSFVTLSTLGYGDISPINRVAQAWVSVEAMVGQFYIAIVMARLVSMYTVSEEKSLSREE